LRGQADPKTVSPSPRMSEQFTTLFDPTTQEFLFMIDGIPDITAHTLWRLGTIHIYRPGDRTNILVLVDPHGHRTDWPFCHHPSSTQLPTHPWISYDEVTYGLADTEIVAFDIWRRGHTSEVPPAHWEEYDRPVLDRPPSEPLILPRTAERPTERPTTIPPHIQRLVIDAAIAAGTICPITMEPITTNNAIVTPCGHVFGTELTFRLSVRLCPICRAPM
jgi:hypothetical protein